MIKNLLQANKTKRHPTKFETSFIKEVSEKLAKESGLKKDWISNILLMTLPEEPLASSAGPAALLLFKPSLFEAMKYLTKDEVVDYFNESLKELAVMEELFDTLIEELPFQKFEDFEKIYAEFEQYLAEQTEPIVERGFISESFKKSYWLQEIFTESRHSPKFKRTYSDIESIDQINKNKYDQIDSALSAQSTQNILEASLKTSKNLIGLREQLRLSLFMRQGFLSLPAEHENSALPKGLVQKEKAYRAALQEFSLKSFKALKIGTEAAKPENLMQDCWELLLAELKHDHIELLMNKNFRALGFDGKKPEGMKYAYGQKLVSSILFTSGLIVELAKEDFLYSIHEKLEPITERYRNSETNQIRTIDASVYEAIYFCGYESVKEACNEFRSAIDRIRRIERSVEKTMDTVHELSISRIREARKQLVILDYIKLTTGFDAGIVVNQPIVDPPVKLESGAFTTNFSEYRSKNPDFKTFKFSKLKRRAVEILFKAHQSGSSAVTTTKLVEALYTEKKFMAMPKNSEDRYKWRLTHDLFHSSDPEIQFGFIKPGPIKNDDRTYMMDFSFENQSPSQILKEKSEKKENRNKAAQAEKEKLKPRTELKKKKPAKNHSWRSDSIARKSSVKKKAK